MTWHKSSFSNLQCVEVARNNDGTVLVRHSRYPTGPHLRFTEGEWEAFIRGVREGEFDLDAGETP